MRKYFTWLIASIFLFYQFLLQTIASVMNDSWMKSFHINHLGVSNLSSAFFYAYVLMQIPIGIIFDRFKPRIVLSSAALILTVSCFLLAKTDSYYLAIIARFFMGFGSAFGFIGLLQIIAEYFDPKRFSFMLGISEAFCSLSVTVSIISFAWLINTFGWRSIMLTCSVIAALLMTSIFLFTQDKNTQHEINEVNASIIFKQIMITLKMPQVLLASFYTFFMFAIVNAFTSLWGVSFLSQVYAIDRATAAQMISMVFIGIAIGGPLNGFLTNRFFSQRSVMIAGACITTLLMSGIIFWQQPSHFTLFLLLLLGGIFCSTYIQAFAIIKDNAPAAVRGTSLAVANMIIMSGAPILQLLIGGLLQMHFSYRFSLAILPAGMFIAVLCALAIKPKSE